MKTNNTKEKGFTLIELMVSVGIFALVLLLALSSIVTIIDVNRKARTLNEVMSNLNFAFESMTRSIKTGSSYNAGSGVVSSVGCDNVVDGITVEAIDPDADPEDFDTIEIQYRLCENDDIGVIERRVGGGSFAPITSEGVDIDILDFRVFAHNAGGTPSEFEGGVDYPSGSQPRVLIIIGGTIEQIRGAGSEFHIQTSVSQLNLNL